MNRVEVERTLLCKFFYALKDKERIVETLFSCAQEPDIDVVVRGGLNDDFIYGIVLEIYKAEPKADMRETPPTTKTKAVRADRVSKRVPKSPNTILGCSE